MYKPMKDAIGAPSGSEKMKKGYRALSNLTKFIVGSIFAQKVAKKMGYDAYGLFKDRVTTPLSPGMSEIISKTERVQNAVQEGEDGGFTIEQTVENITTGMDIVGSAADTFIPFLKSMSDMYEAHNNVYGVNTMKLLENQLYETGVLDKTHRNKFNKADRDTYESIMRGLTGGFKEKTD
jgi:hypothetical protein